MYVHTQQEQSDGSGIEFRLSLKKSPVNSESRVWSMSIGICLMSLGVTPLNLMCHTALLDSSDPLMELIPEANISREIGKQVLRPPSQI